MSTTKAQKGQGSQINPHNRFLQLSYETEGAYQDYLIQEGEDDELRAKTKIIELHPKTIVNEVKSPDVGMNWSLNPYQGCEHGCSYCYARNTHEFWGYSAGIDFERTILVKKTAPALLEQFITRRSWKAEPIFMSGNTDCYQPVERHLEITRQLLEVFWKYRHPVGIITKNALIQRDIDILESLAKLNLIHVILSVTTMDEELRNYMEPRTASVRKRLDTIRALAAAGIPVSVMMAPIIPGLNSHEIFGVLNAVKKAGARNAMYTMVRLNGQVGEIFSDWIHQTLPEKASKVLKLVSDIRDGKLSDSMFGVRMKGTGQMAQNINETFSIARQKIFGTPDAIVLNTNEHIQYKKPQLRLF